MAISHASTTIPHASTTISHAASTIPHSLGGLSQYTWAAGTAGMRCRHPSAVLKHRTKKHKISFIG